MPRNMSVAYTKDAVLKEAKDVTRRLGRWFVKPGDIVHLVNRTMGFKKGERPVRYKTVRIVSARPEPLNAITQEECRREGFPDLTPTEFVALFSRHNKCSEDRVINRIEWQYVTKA